jgi:hypothetical protein
MKPHLTIVLFCVALVTSACSPRDDRPAPGAPLPSDPAAAPAPTTIVPKLPDPQAPDGPAARDSRASNPRGEMTPQEESTAMPKAGQANNHSSPSLEPRGESK